MNSEFLGASPHIMTFSERVLAGCEYSPWQPNLPSWALVEGERFAITVC